MARKLQFNKEISEDEEKLIQDEKVIINFKKFIQKSSKYFKADLDRMKNDLAFASSDQYDDKDAGIRGKERVKFVFNLIRNYCNSIINSYRVKPFGMIVEAKSKDNIDKAKEGQAFVRGIEIDSNGINAYCNAIDRSVKGGKGYVLITSNFANEENFDQEIKIQQIINSTSVAPDPYSKEIDGSDQNELAIIDSMSLSEAKEEFGDDVIEDIQDYKDNSSLTDTAWQELEDCVSVITYFVKKKKRIKIFQNIDGSILQEKDVPKGVKLKSRFATTTSICVYTIIGNKIINETELPMNYIPVVPFMGERIDKKDGKVFYVGIPFFAKDTQKLVNFTGSLSVERIALSPKAPYLVDYKSIAPYINTWQSSNRLNLSFLPYDSLDENGKPYAAPFKANTSADINDTITAQSTYEKLMSSIIGIPENGLMSNATANETAEAVLTKTRSAETNNFQYLHNASISMKQICRICIEMGNILYDTPREVTMSYKDGVEKKTITFSELNIKPSELIFNVDSGPMIATARKENLKSLLALGGMLGPDVALSFAHSIVKNADFEDSLEIAGILKQVAKVKLGITYPEDTEAGGIPPEAQQALDSASQAVDALTTKLNDANNYITQLQNAISSSNAEAQAVVTAQELKNKGNLQTTIIKENAANERQKQKIVADALKTTAQIQADAIKSVPSTEIPQFVPNENIVVPEYTSVGGLKSRIF